MLIVGTFSGYTGDLHPFVVIFVTKVHMPSPLRTPGRRLDMGGGSGYISGMKAEDRAKQTSYHADQLSSACRANL